MIGDERLLTWTNDCSYGTREWLLHMEDGSAALECIAAEEELLPDLDVALLLDALRDSGFGVPGTAATEESTRLRAGVAAPAWTKDSDTGPLRSILHETPWLDRAPLLDPFRDSGVGVPGTTADTVPPLPILPETPWSPPPDAGDSLVTLLLTLETIGNSYAPGAELRHPVDISQSGPAARLPHPLEGSHARGRHAKSANPPRQWRAERPPAAAPQLRGDVGGGGGFPCELDSTADPVAAMYRSFNWKMERLLTEWTSGPADPRTSTTGQASMAVSEIVAGIEASQAPLEAQASPVHLAPALDRLVETLTTIGTQIQQQHPAPPPPAQAAEAVSSEVRWLEDDDLAARLHAILKRQARRRGIDLS